jgi:hypothetical protein
MAWYVQLQGTNHRLRGQGYWSWLIYKPSYGSTDQIGPWPRHTSSLFLAAVFQFLIPKRRYASTHTASSHRSIYKPGTSKCKPVCSWFQVDAGASFIITQFFFQVDDFVSFVQRCRRIGITVPIIPGVILIQVTESSMSWLDIHLFHISLTALHPQGLALFSNPSIS